MSKEEESKYLYPVDVLDKLIQEMDEGIEPMLNDQMIIEIEMRRKEIAEKLGIFDDDDDDNDFIKQKHQEIMREHMKQQAKKAHRDDVMYIEISQDQKDKLREEMESSFVRKDPTLTYNLSEEEIYATAEEKLILEKLSKLRRAYYNQQEFQNAINLILAAVEYSLEHDYPWMSHDEAIRAFNEGRIRFTYCQIPQLFLDFRTQVKDPNILQGVVNGEVELVDKHDMDYVINRYEDSELISVPYSVISHEEEQYYIDAHKHGMFTPLSPVIQSNNTIYNRFRPTYFSNKKDDNMYTGLVDQQGNPVGFDWTQDDAHNRYDMFRKGKKYDINMLIEDVNKKNGGNINKQIAMNMQSYMYALNSTSLSHDERLANVQDGYKHQNEEIVKMEQSILEKIQMNNIIKMN